MAQNEVKRYPTGLNLCNGVQNKLSTFFNAHYGLEKVAINLNGATGSDYPDLEANTLTDLVSLRTEINSFLSESVVTDFMTFLEDYIRI